MPWFHQLAKLFTHTCTCTSTHESSDVPFHSTAVDIIIIEELDLLKPMGSVVVGNDVRVELEEGIESSGTCLLRAQDDHGW